MKDEPSWARVVERGYHALRRALRVVTRPVRRDRGGLEGVVVQPYRGYGTADGLYLKGRVFRQPGWGAGLPDGSLIGELADLLRRVARWGMANTTVTARFEGALVEVETDRDGYFELELEPVEPPSTGERWHTVHLEVRRQDANAEAEGFVYVAPSSAQRVVVSDIDDTVMYTGVASRLKMLWRLFLQDAESRVAFPGVRALYRGFHEGPSGAAGNPMLYVSRAPWSIYEVLEAFFRMKEIPEGPVLFLREWGVSLQSPLPRRSEDHKRELVEGMLARYPDRPFVLIGDSGQHDPEIYADIVRRHPGRIEAVYIRDVDDTESRRAEIERLGAETDEAGCPLVLAADSRTMAMHAAEAGLVSERVVTEVADAVTGNSDADRGAV